MPHHVKHRVRAVFNQHVRLFLTAVPEDFEAFRRRDELVDEVEDDAMRAASTDDVGKAEDPGAETKRSHIRSDEALARGLAGPVQRDGDARTVVFWGRQGRAFAVHHRRRGEGDVLHAMLPHGLKDVVGRDGAVTKVGVGHARAETNVGVGRKVNHPVDASKMRERGLEIGEVNDLERDASGLKMVRQEFPAAARQVVNDDDFVTTLDQAVDHVGPDEARSTRHQPTHGPS